MHLIFSKSNWMHFKYTLWMLASTWTNVEIIIYLIFLKLQIQHKICLAQILELKSKSNLVFQGRLIKT